MKEILSNNDPIFIIDNINELCYIRVSTTMEETPMKRLILVIIIALAGVWYGIRAVDTVQASVSRQQVIVSEAFRK